MSVAEVLGTESRLVTALFRNLDAAERAYRAATALGYPSSEIDLVLSDATRDHLLGAGHSAHPNLSSNAADTTETSEKGTDLGGPMGGALGTIAPVLAAVGTVVLVPGLLLVGPIAIALTAAGAVGLAGGMVSAFKHWGLPHDRVEDHEAAIRNGGILIGVKARSDADAHQLEQQWQTEGGRFVHR